MMLNKLPVEFDGAASSTNSGSLAARCRFRAMVARFEIGMVISSKIGLFKISQKLLICYPCSAFNEAVIRSFIGKS
jgi:hypothetical protein